jgi:hypothetical protein
MRGVKSLLVRIGLFFLPIATFYLRHGLHSVKLTFADLFSRWLANEKLGIIWYVARLRRLIEFVL